MWQVVCRWSLPFYFSFFLSLIELRHEEKMWCVLISRSSSLSHFGGEVIPPNLKPSLSCHLTCPKGGLSWSLFLMRSSSFLWLRLSNFIASPNKDWLKWGLRVVCFPVNELHLPPLWVLWKISWHTQNHLQ